MNTADYIILAVLVVSAVLGALRGFLREAISVLTWIVALFVAWHFSGLLEPHLGGSLSDPHVRPWAARAIIVLLVLVLGTAIGAVLAHFVRLSIFSSTDRLLGFAFGILRGAVVLGVFVMLGQAVKLAGEPWWTHSRLIPYGESIAGALRALVGDERLRHSSEGAHV